MRKIIFTLMLFGSFFISAHAQNTLTQSEIDEYKEQSKSMVKFLEGTLNFLGDETSTAKEKEIIITSSFLKMFKDAKVQVEDDLDEKREINIAKDIQAYLKDVDFFFKKAKFEFTIEEVNNFVNENNQVYFKVVLNRNLQAVTIDGDVVNSNKLRYIEINLDETSRDLKIVSIYTNKLNEQLDLNQWWESLSLEWAVVLAQNVGINEDISLAQLKTIVAREDLDISNNKKLTDLEPLSKLTNLKRLNISNTKINSLSPLRNLTKIEVINATNSQISSIATLKYCTGLRELSVSKTRINDLSVTSNFPALEKLDISFTSISNLEFLEFLPNMKDLRINNSPISSLKPIVSCKQLEYLKASDTKINTLDDLKTLANLQVLFIENTSVSSLEPLSGKAFLTSVFCNNTRISSLDPLLSCPQINKIYCDNTQINGEKAGLFISKKQGCLVIYDSESQSKWWASLSEDWKNIFRKQIKLSGNPTKEELQELVNLSIIDISGYSNINSIEPIRKLINLKELRMPKTSVSSLEPIRELFDLRILDASNTKITSIDPLVNARNMESLNISSTNVTKLDALKNLRNLSVLKFSRTQVQNVEVLNAISSLQTVHANQTSVQTQDIENFVRNRPQCLVVYRTQELNDWWMNLQEGWKDIFNSIEKIEKSPSEEQLHRLTRIEVLKFSENYQISDLEPLRKMIYLKELRFSDTNISNLLPIAQNSSLEILQCSNSPISNLDVLSNFEKLKVLDCRFTKVKSLKAVSKLKNLEQLNISGTKVRWLSPLKTSQNLIRIEMHNTRVILLSALKNMQNLKVLKCYNTHVFKPIANSFKKAHADCLLIYF